MVSVQTNIQCME